MNIEQCKKIVKLNERKVKLKGDLQALDGAERIMFQKIHYANPEHCRRTKSVTRILGDTYDEFKKRNGIGETLPMLCPSITQESSNMIKTILIQSTISQIKELETKIENILQQ